LVGKVVFRIPWIGYIALFVQNHSGILIIIVLIIIILIAKFAILTSKSKKAKVEPETNVKRLAHSSRIAVLITLYFLLPPFAG
jgi:flagellar basal body-associated protein FliL